MTDLHCSVIIPVGGSSGVLTLLPEQLDALASQIDAPSFEVIIADNGMGPALAEVVRRYEDRLDIRTIDASDKRGASHARNCGAAAARSERLLFCDADDIVSHNWVSELSGASLKPRVALHSPVIVFTKTELLADMDEATSFYRNNSDYEYLGPKERPFFGGCCFALMKADYVSLGGMDESFPHGGEDLDLFLRVGEDGIQVHMLETCHIFYRVAAEGTTSGKKHFHYARGDVLMAFRHLQRHGKPARREYRWSSSLRDVLRIFASKSRHDITERVGILLGHLEAKAAIRLLKHHQNPELFDFGAVGDEC